MSERNTARDALWAQVVEALRRVSRASDFYRRKLEGAGVSVEDITTPADLRRFPITRKSEIAPAQQSSPPFGPLLAVPRERIANVSVSPGPIYIPRTAEEPTGVEALHESLRHMGVTPTINPTPPVMVARNHDTPVTPAAARVSEPNVVAIPANMTEAGLPDLRGMGAREAVRELARLGMSARMQGTGVVVDQNPPAGAPLEAGATCTLVLSRVLPRPAAAGDQR